MKRRNDKWLREKELRRLSEKRDELFQQTREVEYLPLEKPVFAGWDIVLYVDTERRDKADLEAVIKIMGWNEDFFIRDVNKVRAVRKDGHTFDSYVNLRKSYYGFRYNYLSPKNFDKVHPDLKKYFDIFKTPYGEYYYLNWNFPFYVISVRVKKSYYYFRRVYNTVAQSEYDKLNGYLYDLHDVKYWRRWRDEYRKSNQGAMKKSLKKLVRNQYTPDDILDDVNLFRGCFDKKDYGWNFTE